MKEMPEGTILGTLWVRLKFYGFVVQGLWRGLFFLRIHRTTVSNYKKNPSQSHAQPRSVGFWLVQIQAGG